MDKQGFGEDGAFGGAVFVAARVGEDDVFELQRQFFRKIRNIRDRLFHHPVADNDMPQEIPLVRIKIVGIAAQFAELPDIVQQDAGNDKLGVQPVLFRRPHSQVQHEHHMLQHAADHGVMQAQTGRMFHDLATIIDDKQL